MVAILDHQTRGARDFIFFGLALLIGYDHFMIFNANVAGMLGSYTGLTLCCDGVAQGDVAFVFDCDHPAFRNIIFVADHFAVFNPYDALFADTIRLDHFYNTANPGNDSFAFWSTAGFK